MPWRGEPWAAGKGGDAWNSRVAGAWEGRGNGNCCALHFCARYLYLCCLSRLELGLHAAFCMPAAPYLPARLRLYYRLPLTRCNLSRIAAAWLPFVTSLPGYKHHAAWFDMARLRLPALRCLAVPRTSISVLLQHVYITLDAHSVRCGMTCCGKHCRSTIALAL